MANQMSLDGVLDEKQTPEPAAPAAPAETPAPAAEAPAAAPPAPPEKGSGGSRRDVQRAKEQAAQEEGRARAADGKFAKTEEKAPETEKKEAPKQEFTDKERAFLKAAEEERHKRQELERRIADMEARNAKAPAAPAGEEKQFWDDPETKMREFQTQIERVSIDTRLNTAEMIARSRHEDFDANVAIFGELVRTTPGLREQWLSAPDPAEFAYRLGANHKRLQDAGNIDNLLASERERIEAETRVKIEAEYKARAEAEAKERAALPGSLSDVRGTSRQNATFTGPTSLDDVLGSK